MFVDIPFDECRHEPYYEIEGNLIVARCRKCAAVAAGSADAGVNPKLPRWMAPQKNLVTYHTDEKPKESNLCSKCGHDRKYEDYLDFCSECKPGDPCSYEKR